MTHNDIYKIFTWRFPALAEIVTDWFPCGKDRIRLIAGKIVKEPMIFTFHDNENWSLESMVHYNLKIKNHGHLD